MDQETVRSIFEYRDGGLFWRVRTGSRCNMNLAAGSVHPKGYRHIKVNGRLYSASRLVWIYHFGSVPNGMEIDHIDLNRDNNNIENLRLCTRQQNVQHRTGGSKGRMKGVKLHKTGRFEARIRDNGKYYYIGIFDTEEEAKAAYNREAQRRHKEFFCP